MFHFRKDSGEGSYECSILATEGTERIEVEVAMTNHILLSKELDDFS